MNAHQQRLAWNAPRTYACKACGAPNQCFGPNHRCLDCEVAGYGAPDTPMEQATREVEAKYNSPRTVWEPTIGHPYNLEVLDRAKQIAGIVDKPHTLPRTPRRR